MKNLWQGLGRLAYWLGWPVIWLNLRGSQRTRLLLVTGDSVLVVKGWISNGKWLLPGGGIHSDESPEQGLLRELAEETGINLAANQLQTMATEAYRRHGYSFTCHYFSAGVDKSLAVRPQPSEIIEARWTRLSELNASNSGDDVLRAIELWKAKA